MSKVGPNIYKRKDGRWEARYVKSILPNGKKQYGSVYARTYQEVRKKQISFLQEPTIQQRFANQIHFVS